MLKQITRAGLSLALLGAAALSTATTADARSGRHAAGIGGGTIIGLGVLGAYAHARERGHYRSCYPGRRHCEVVGQRCWYTRHGEYVCKDDVRCYRPRVCD